MLLNICLPLKKIKNCFYFFFSIGSDEKFSPSVDSSWNFANVDVVPATGIMAFGKFINLKRETMPIIFHPV